MITGDELRLAGQEGLFLTVTAGLNANDPRDGHNFHVVSWTGQYNGEETGTAFGAIIDQGPLKGLISSVTRVLEIPFGEDGNIANFTESQLLTRVLSPAVVTAEENSAPIISDLYLFEGLVICEGGSVATLVADVSDIDWNLEQVTVDLTSIGGGIVAMNDRGLDGDSAIGDDKYTTRIIVPGLEVGNISLSVSAIDSFDVATVFTKEISVVNQAPRLTSVEILPNQGPRGTNMVVNLAAYDGHGVASVDIDLRDYGGGLVSLNYTGQVWSAMMVIPNGMSPGTQSLKVITIDDLGKVGITSTWLNGERDQESQYGPHFIPDDEKIPIEIFVENSAPEIINPGAVKYSRPDSATTEIFELEITDQDGILNARVNLGVFSPIDQQNRWVQMNDNGINGDRVPNDGIFTVQISLRTSTPIGTHEILVQAIDNFEVATVVMPISVTVEEETGIIPSLDSEQLSVSVLVGILIAFTIVAGTAVFVLVRRSKDKDYANDRFGFE
jgi:hypothetical protein